MAVVKGNPGRGNGNGKPNSYAATSGSNTAELGATNARGLLLYTPASSTLDGVDFNNFFSASYANGSTKGIALTPGTYFVRTAFQRH